ncbi:hypothetical protein EJ08DRAFT_601403, partial [Tothia fuscella]
RVVICRGCFERSPGPSPLEQDVREGENPVSGRWRSSCEAPSTSRVVWECSSKLVVNSI